LKVAVGSPCFVAHPVTETSKAIRIVRNAFDFTFSGLSLVTPVENKPQDGNQHGGQRRADLRRANYSPVESLAKMKPKAAGIDARTRFQFATVSGFPSSTATACEQAAPITTSRPAAVVFQFLIDVPFHTLYAVFCL
jgi:hypothetical protein